MAGFFSISGEAGGQFRTEAEAETRAYYADSLRSGMTPTDFPYTETVFEQSLLDRVLEQGAPGEIWQPAEERNHTTGRTVRSDYGTCTSSEQDAVKLFVLTAEGITYQSDYPAGSLMKTVLKDENWTSGADGTVETYTDNEGRTVLERRIHTATNGTEHLDTYYVYDDLNRLRYVLPSQAEEIFRQAGETRSGSDKGIADYAYAYRYDGNGNCISKKMPGSEAVEMVYDKARRRVLSRDGKCRNEGKWMFWLYDGTGRQAVQGICTNPDVESIKNDIVITRWTDRGTLAGYESPEALGEDIQLLKADYYDNYAFLEDEELLPEDRQEYGKVYPDPQKPDAAGLKTGTVSYAADGSGTLTGMEVLYYDSFGRCVQKRLKNHLGETDEEYTAYTFTGLPRLVMRVHHSPEKEERKETLRYEYDTMERLLKVYFRLDDKEEELVCDNVYDDLGRIVANRRNGTDNLRTGYTYNIRNWMTAIESPLFKEELHYTDGTGTPCYNGNISSISWKAGEEQSTRGYRFTYDGLDRMKKAEYGEGERLAINPNRFNEEVTAYDKTGNILGIRRMGQTGAQEYGLVDNLVLSYSGNQLTKVTDNAASSAYNNGFEFKDGADKETEYAYDENGNLTQDLNRNIKDIQYNFLNLPQRIEFEDGSTTEYLYDADGRKLRTVHKADGKTTTTDYAGNLIYENGNPVRLLTGYGYVSLPDGMYHYYLKDHQGNNRVVADRNGKVEEVNHYYPFGGMFATTGNVQPYKYNGKELDTRKGLNWYDYGARYYDPALGRWHVKDPMQEKRIGLSPYCYTSNNPVNRIDPNGMLDDWGEDVKTNKIEWKDNITSASQTPEGYRYVGKNEKDILYHFNLPTTYDTKQEKAWSGGIDGDEKIPMGIAPQGGLSSSSGNLTVSANVTTDSSQVTQDNAQGKVFEGITFTANLSQQALSSNESYRNIYSGWFSVFYDKKYTTPLVRPKRDIIYATGTVPRTATISIPAQNLNRNSYFSHAVVEAGATNSGALFTQSVRMEWNLKLNLLFIQQK